MDCAVGEFTNELCAPSSQPPPNPSPPKAKFLNDWSNELCGCSSGEITACACVVDEPRYEGVAVDCRVVWRCGSRADVGGEVAWSSESETEVPGAKTGEDADTVEGVEGRCIGGEVGRVDRGESVVESGGRSGLDSDCD